MSCKGEISGMDISIGRDIGQNSTQFFNSFLFFILFFQPFSKGNSFQITSVRWLFIHANLYISNIYIILSTYIPVLI